MCAHFGEIGSSHFLLPYLQTRTDERNADYWRIATTLDQEIPPAWVTHAARKHAKRARLLEDTKRQPDSGATHSTSPEISLQSRGPFQDRVDRVFFFGDLNYRVDLSREDLCGRVAEAIGAEGGREMANLKGTLKLWFAVSWNVVPFPAC